MKNIPKMPEEYIGEYNKMNPYVKNLPRKWTDEEVDWCLKMREDGYTIEQIAESTGRKKVSVSLKMKRLTKRNDTYNEAHIEEKYRANDKFLEYLQPKSILDVYAGKKSYYLGKAKYVKSNDLDMTAKTDEHMEALKFLCKLHIENKKYDIVDLDPYGSAYDCFDLAIKTAKKGLIITFGEMGHKRWGRLDYVKSHYGVDKLEDFHVNKLIETVHNIGIRNKKRLQLYSVYNWRNISRAYFLIEKYKVTEQWEKNLELKNQKS
jgi:hypothetical protein